MLLRKRLFFFFAKTRSVPFHSTNKQKTKRTKRNETKRNEKNVRTDIRISPLFSFSSFWWEYILRFDRYVDSICMFMYVNVILRYVTKKAISRSWLWVMVMVMLMLIILVMIIILIMILVMLQPDTKISFHFTSLLFFQTHWKIRTEGPLVFAAFIYLLYCIVLYCIVLS